MRHHGTDVLLDLVEQPAPIGGGDTRHPDQGGVAPFKEVPDETFPAKVVLHHAGTFDDGLHHLQCPRGPMARRQPWGFLGASIAGSSSTPRGTQRATVRRRIESRSRPMAAPSFRKRPSSAIFFALIRRGADDEKTPFEGPPEEPVVGEGHTIVGPFVQASSQCFNFLATFA